MPEDRRLRDALSASRGVFAGVGGFSFVINALLLTVPIYMLQIYDRVLTSRSFDTLILLTVLAVGLLLTIGLLEFTRLRLLTRVGTLIDARLNLALFAALVGAQLGGQAQSGSQPLRDLDTLRGYLSGHGLLAFFDAPWTPLFVGIIFLMHPLLGTIALASVIVLFGLAILSELTSRAPLKEAAKATIHASTFADAALRNAEAIKALGMLPGIRQRWLKRHQTSILLQTQASDRVGLISAVAKFTRLVVQIAMLGTGAYLAIQQIITPGVMIAASIILSRALAPVEAAIGGWRNFIGARSAYARLQALLTANPARRTTMALPRPVGKLLVDGLAAAPPGFTKPFLLNIGIAIEPGEMLGIIGPSAAGKSMLARLLVGIWVPLAGHIRLDGADISEWDRDQLGPYIGYLPQDVALLDGTVEENISRFGAPDPDATVAAAMKAGVHEMILGLPKGYDTMLGTGGTILPGGQRQRVALARALYGDPCVIVLDEPNSNLDNEGEGALRDIIRGLKSKGKTLVVVSHRYSVLLSADKILVLREGRKILFGDRDDVLAKIAPSTSNNAVAPQPSKTPAETANKASPCVTKVQLRPIT